MSIEPRYAQGYPFQANDPENPMRIISSCNQGKEDKLVTHYKVSCCFAYALVLIVLASTAALLKSSQVCEADSSSSDCAQTKNVRYAAAGGIVAALVGFVALYVICCFKQMKHNN